ncbi:MAG: PKD domain-containing protein [Cyclobacteriaceae bacterium]
MKHINLFGVMITSLLLLSACQDEEIVPEPQLPIASFTYSGDQSTDGKLALVPVVISFQNTSEFSDSIKWDFGDGETSTDENPQHTYTENGTYSISLIAMNTDGSDTSSTEINIGVAAAPMSLATSAEGVTVFSLEYDLSATSGFEGTPTYFLELSTYSDFSQMIEFSDEDFQNPISEKVISGTGTYQFKDLKPGSWYYYRIRQELAFGGHTYGPFYSEVKTAKLGALLAPGLTVTTYAENACIMKLTATINEPPGESLYLTGSDVQLSFSYEQNLSNPITLEEYNPGGISLGESFYYRRPGSTIFIRGVYEYKGRMAYSNILSYTTDGFIANLSSKTFSGSIAEIQQGSKKVIIGDQSEEHIRFEVIGYEPNTLSTYSIDHSTFEYEDDNNTDYKVNTVTEFHEKVVLRILEETDTYIIAQLVNQDDMSSDLYYSTSTGGSTENIFMSGLIFKADKVQ